MNRIFVSTIAASSFLLFACGGSANAPPVTEPGSTATTTPSTSTPPANFADQVARGQKLYADNCASCHGASGEGGKAPRVVGLSQGALPLDPPSTS
ncbi:MAG: cytochrome c, partial [Polyangiaceae bacterium]